MATKKVTQKKAKGFGCPGDLREYLATLERAGELRRVKEEVDWRFEAGAMSRLVCERRGPAPLFEKIKDYPGQQLAAVLLGPSKPATHARVALALGLERLTPTLELIETVRERLRQPVAPRLVGRSEAPCKEVIVKGKQANLLSFPVPWIKAIDGGRYVGTWDIVVTKEPKTGWVNWGTYRCMVKDENHFAVLLRPRAHQHGGAAFKKYQAAGKPMPIALVIGADQASHLAAITPLDYGVSEPEAAGGLRGESIALVKCETSDLEVPANAEIVIEAQVLPGEGVDEGPFGEYTGHRVLRGKAPVAEVTCITHRRNPISTMANMGKPLDDAAGAQHITYSAQARNRLEAHGIEVNSVYYYVPHVPVISVKPSAGLQKRVVATLLSGERLLTSAGAIVFVDEDVDVTDVGDVWWAICSRMNPRSYEVIAGAPLDDLMPFLTPEERQRREGAIGLMDATIPYHWSDEYRDAHTMVSDFKHGWPEETKSKVLERWEKYGYGDVK